MFSQEPVPVPVLPELIHEVFGTNDTGNLQYRTALISRADTQLKRGFVCSRHFKYGVSAPSWDKHNIDWVPTVSLGHNKRDPCSSEAASNRAKRTLKRKKSIDEVQKQFKKKRLDLYLLKIQTR